MPFFSIITNVGTRINITLMIKTQLFAHGCCIKVIKQFHVLKIDNRDVVSLFLNVCAIVHISPNISVHFKTWRLPRVPTESNAWFKHHKLSFWSIILLYLSYTYVHIKDAYHNHYFERRVIRAPSSNYQT